MIVPLILDNSPNTAMILGAALSGGDPMMLAKALAEKEKRQEDDIPNKTSNVCNQ